MAVAEATRVVQPGFTSGDRAQNGIITTRRHKIRKPLEAGGPVLPVHFFGDTYYPL